MTTTDYIINAVLVLLVLRQVRERKLDLRSFLLPVVLVAFAAHNYLHTIPTGGHDLQLIVVLGFAGVLLGSLAGRFTHVRAGEDGAAWARAGWGAGTLWVLGIGSRMAFAFVAQHGAAQAIGQFSLANHITGGAAWTAAFVIMALAEVLARLAVLAIRAHLATRERSAALDPRPAGA